MKLDNCGVKLKLSHWNQLSHAERQTLIDLPGSSESERKSYRQWLQNLLIAKTGEPAKELEIDPHPPWLDTESIPSSVAQKAIESQIELSLSQWASLSPYQRFALIKLSRHSHENKNFIPALVEFGIATPN